MTFSKNTEKHGRNLENLFHSRKDNRLKLRNNGYSVVQPSVEPLGQIVDKNGVHVDDQNEEKLSDAVPLTMRWELRSFLSLTSYYRRFIPGFAKIAKPLTDKISDKVKFVWSEEIQTAFEELNVNLTSAPVLSYPDYENLFIVCTDASSRAVGAFLFEADENSRDRSVHYAN